MKYIYVDIGAYSGDTIEQFLNWKRIKYSDDIEWEIYAFEPNPAFNYSRFVHHKNVHFIREAAWIKNEEVEFAIDPSPDSPMGSTMISEKTSHWQIGKKIKVQAFDFSDWLKQFREDYVIVKMDCEGAEFKILEKMLEDKTITIPNLLLVEFHQNKVINYTTKDKDNLVERIKKAGGNIREWH